MARTIQINPITRIEGHAKISIHLDEHGLVEEARMHVTQLRGFETLIEGRPFYELPSLMARICGICPVSHLVAAAKACDDLFSVQIPRAAILLRRMMNLAQIMQSHALSYFYLSSPDLVFGMDADPAKRNLFGLHAEHPQMARDGITLRQIGQQIIELLGSKRIHPAWVVPGGVNAPLSDEKRREILAKLPEAKEIILRTLDQYKEALVNFEPEIGTFGNFPSLFMGLVDRHGNLEHYDGRLRVIDSAGNNIIDQHDTLDYASLIGEAVEPWSFVKFPYYKPMGYPKGMYRVGPLARLNLIDQCGTELADKELLQFKGGDELKMFGKRRDDAPVLSSFHYHWARLIEILFCIERIESILDDPAVMDTHVRAHAEPNSFDGIGVTEAPRGTLVHHYKIDQEGKVTWSNLIIATGHNNLAMNRGITQAAKTFIDGDNIREGMLNRVEAVIRAFDPCLSCSSHAAGQMPMIVELVDSEGQLVRTLKRDSTNS
ncbi:Ni/Fe hydrogenase subunit alpha [bacterium]|nr:Ni/Fe hydrogenase subunit alpha [bacterium]